MERKEAKILKKSIAVFCGSSDGNDPIYIETAARLGKTLAKQKRRLVYGGAQVGCMGTVADHALEHNGEVIGVIPKSLSSVEIAHHGLSELHIVDTMHQRKAKMAELADGFIALPGGVGTLEEFFEIFTWSQIDLHDKPYALLNVDGFYDPLIDMLEHTIEKGFMSEKYRQQLIVSHTIEDVLSQLDAYEKTVVNKWTE
jgi:hypothetical protein